MLLKYKSNHDNASLSMLEQRGRNNHIRIFGLKVDAETSASSLNTADFVYSKILKPILNIAVLKKKLAEIPKPLSLIEYCHTMPAPKKAPGSTPIIVKLHSRLMRQLIFRHKKEFFSAQRNIEGCFISEDLTAESYRLLKDLKPNPLVLKAWSLNGRLKSDTNTVKNYDGNPIWVLPVSLCSLYFIPL